MMKLVKTLLFISWVGFSTNNFALDETTLDEAKLKVITQYINYLEQADYKNISALFSKNGYVVSTSQGKMNAKDFFYAVLPKIQSARTELNEVFVKDKDKNRYAVRFHFTYRVNLSEIHDSEYVDEFVFEDNSSTIAAVYMFENIFFTPDDDEISNVLINQAHDSSTNATHF